MSHKKEKNKKKSQSSAYLSKGVLDVTRSGMGFVKIENREQDILVRPNDFNTALHGDTCGNNEQPLKKRSAAGKNH